MKNSVVLIFASVYLMMLAVAVSADNFPPETRSIYGIHDHWPVPTEYLNAMKDKVGGGWVTATLEIGHDPNNMSSADFTHISSQGHTVIGRLNNGYAFNGTIPASNKYDDFAQRCANFVKNSKGCHIWVIGNETNLAVEWPLEDGRYKYVSPQDYAVLFRKVYNAIKAVRPNDRVIPQALAPWAGPYGPGTQNGLPHDGVPINWVQYKHQMLTAIKNTGPLDGIAVHINSRGYSYNAIHSTAKMSAAGMQLYNSFYVYKDWVEYGIPQDLYHLPIYATECNGMFYWKGGHAEDPSQHYQAGWMQEVHAEIDRYNQQAILEGKPIYRAVIMYRWCDHCDGWNIDGNNPYKSLIMSDLNEALDQNHRWPDTSGVIVDDSDSGFSVLSGSWPIGTGAPGKYGATYRFHATTGGTGQNKVRWTPNLPQEGMYEVFVWYPEGGNRAPDAPYTVTSLNGDETVRVDQRSNGGRWNSIGTFPFKPGNGYVTLSDDAQPTVVLADAVRWRYEGPLPSTGSLSGHVRDNNGVGVQGTSVTLQPGNRATATGPGGAFQLNNLQAGLYSVRANKPGYAQGQKDVTIGTGATNVEIPLLAQPAESIQDAKTMTDGTGIAIAGRLVSANMGARFWMQELDRSNAIRVDGPWPLAVPGAIVNVSGMLGTDLGERRIANAAVAVTGQTDPPRPIVMSTAAVGGASPFPNTPGIPEAHAFGPHNVGLYVTVAGRVTSVPTSTVFYIDDGRGLKDGTGNTGIRVFANGVAPLPSVGQLVSVTGIATLYHTGSRFAGALRTWNSSFIQLLAP